MFIIVRLFFTFSASLCVLLRAVFRTPSSTELPDCSVLSPGRSYDRSPSGMVLAPDRLAGLVVLAPDELAWLEVEDREGEGAAL